MLLPKQARYRAAPLPDARQPLGSAAFKCNPLSSLVAGSGENKSCLASGSPGIVPESRSRTVLANGEPKSILPFLRGKIGEPRKERFWAKVDIRGPEECWEWQGARHGRGYGSFKIASHESVTASRMALICHEMREPAGLHVLHTCDNPPCCNPAHLYFGTVAQNNADKSGRGRNRTGDQSCANNGAAKLTEAQVELIVQRFRKGMNNKQIAADLPVGHAMVSKIRLGHMWRPVTERLGWITPAVFAIDVSEAAV